MDLGHRLQVLRATQRALDERFRIPGTRIRFGWDPLIGVLPWAGDVATALVACAIVIQAHQMRVPRVVQLRMLVNVGVDLLIGVVPVVGDVADVFWKSNSRNLSLLERHAARPGPATAGDWLFVSAVLTSIVALALVPLFAAYLLIQGLLLLGFPVL